MPFSRRREHVNPSPLYREHTFKGLKWAGHPSIVNDVGQPLPMITNSLKSGMLLDNLALRPREAEKAFAEFSEPVELPEVFGMTALGLLFVFVNADEEILRGLNRPDIFHPSIFQTKFFAPLAGNGPSNSLSPHHDIHKTRFNEVFMKERSKLIAAVNSVVNPKVETLVAALQKNRIFDLAKISQVIGDSALELIFSQDITKREKEILVTFVGRVFTKAPLGTIAPEIVMKTATKLYFKKARAHRIVNRIVKERILKMLPQPETKGHPDVTDRFVQEYLKLMNVQPDQAETWEEAVARQPQLEEVMLLVNEASLNAFTGAADTTSGVLKSAIVELSLNHEIMAELYDEYKSVSGGQLKPTLYPKLLKFIYAILQKWGSVSKSGKHLAKDTVIAGFPFEAGTEILLNLWRVGRGDEYLDDEASIRKFYPEGEMDGGQLMSLIASLPAFGQQADLENEDGVELSVAQGRECPGRLIAVEILFRFLIGLIKNYQKLLLVDPIKIPNKSTLHQESRIRAVPHPA